MDASLRTTLVALGTDLDALAAPAEEAFLEAGNALAATVEDMRRIEAGFDELSERLDDDDAAAAVHGIEHTAAGIAALSQGNGEEAACLGRLAEASGQLAHRLGLLRGVAGEVAVLAMNAKIQASQLTVGAADFAVFTGEMARLATLAQATIDRARTKVGELADAILRARTDEESFARSSAAELAAVQEGLNRGCAVLAERRAAAATAAQAIRERSRAAAAHVAQTIGDLQINDITTQRIGHVRQALDALITVLTEDGADGEALVTPVCRLQHAQLSRTAAEYRGHVEGLIANLRLMSSDLSALVQEAGTAFSGGAGARGSFAGQLEADIDRASRLLDSFIGARVRVQAVMAAVHSGVGTIVADLEAVSSIDADMQVMGLNATFKCGRLGTQGRALAVIAHELRACGKRTEDNTRFVSQLLADITAVADELHRMADVDGKSRLDGLRDGMAQSVSRLDALASALDGALARLDAEGGRASHALDDLAGRIRIHHQVGAVLDRTGQRLAQMSGDGSGDADTDAIRNRLRELLSAHYTMASERLVHQLIAEEDTDTGATGAAAPSGDIDDCFL